jgi:hypothetical protein
MPMLAGDTALQAIRRENSKTISYTAFHIKLPFLELDYTASAKCRYWHFAPFNGQSSSKKATFDESGIFADKCADYEV